MEAKELALKLFHSAHNGIMITDIKGSILTVNPAFTKVTGYTKEEVMGQNPRILKSGLQDQRFYLQMWSTVIKEGIWQGEIWNKRKNGEHYLQMLTIHTMRDQENKITHYVGLFSDITVREQIEKSAILAGKIQRQLLPDGMKNDHFSLKVIFQPSQYVSGDLFDYWWDDQAEVLSGYLVDVKGHGLSTALQASVMRTLFLQAMDKPLSMQEKMAWINYEAMRCFTEDSFAAALFFEIDFRRKRLSYVPAGIPFFLHKTKDEYKIVKCPGFLMGMVAEAEFEKYSIPLADGDQIFLMSDGLFEEIALDRLQLKPSFTHNYEWLNQIASGEIRDDASAVCILIDPKENQDENG